MKKILTLIAALAGAVTLNAQHPGGLSESVLGEIAKGYEGTATDKALRNALNTTPINTLALNADNIPMDTRFSDMVKTKGRTNQLSSGRCWLFTGLNVLRAKMIDKFDMGPVVLSQNYVFFYDQLEKANLFLQGIIDTKDLPDDDRKVDWLFSNPIGDGGQFTGVSNLIMKYGVVPSEVFPESMNANSTSQMRAQLTLKLREDGLRLRQAAKAAGLDQLKGKKREKASADLDAKLQAMKVEQLKEVYRILVLCLGLPPKEFTWTRTDSKGNVVSTENYTPKSFYDKYIGEDLEKNYIMVMNDPCREYYKVYEIDYDRHVYDGENWVYLNLPVDEIKQMAIASIKDNTALYFSCDVNKFLLRKEGFADLNNYDYESLMGVTFGMNKQERIYTHASGSTHAMTLIAVDLKDGKPVKWMVENSWGATSGYQGNIIMTDEWFNEYMFRLVVDKKYVPASIMKYFDQKPVMLPAWDPMFMPEE
ncbi:MAG: C1 family peptidase [Bacteroidales bacterium]|nr:C1 family peptidase [Bacteroidales bacterium]